MSKLLDTLRSINPFSRGADEFGKVTKPLALELARNVDVVFERFRDRPKFIEITRLSRAQSRIQLSIGMGGDLLNAEIPRDVSSLAINTGFKELRSLDLDWKCSGGDKQTTRLDVSQPLKPALVVGTRISVTWDAQDFPELLIRGIRWQQSNGQLIPVTTRTFSIPATDRRWEIPLELLDVHPLELRVTPTGDSGQGLTEVLIVPARMAKIEGIFERVLLPVHGKNWRRLQLVLRRPPSFEATLRVLVEWVPRDRLVKPTTTRKEWPHEEDSITVPFEHISMRGDQVRVQVESSTQDKLDVNWYLVDTYSSPAPKGESSIGATSVNSVFEYTHRWAIPEGEPANILSHSKELLDVPGLEVDAETALGWPTTMSFEFKQIQNNPELLKRLFSIVGKQDSLAHRFDSDPQIALFYLNEPDLRELLLRVPEARSSTVIGNLANYLSISGQQPDGDALVEKWNCCSDDELDKWIAAVAAGANISHLAHFWASPDWQAVELQQLVANAHYLEHVESEPLEALQSEVVLETHLGEQLASAVHAEQRLRSASPAEFASAALSRCMVLRALASHWRQLFATMDDRAIEINQLVQTKPRTAAKALEECSTLEGDWIQVCEWPVFTVEGVLLGKTVQDHNLQSSGLSTAMDWYRTMLELEHLPIWPWLGLLPEVHGKEDLLDLWDSVVAQLERDISQESSVSSELSERLKLPQAVLMKSGDEQLMRLATSVHEKCDALERWLA